MSTLLHDPEALASVATGPRGPARDWALCHLAVLGRPQETLPDGIDEARIAIAAGAAIDSLRDRLKGGKVELDAVAPLALDLCRFGCLPVEPEPWVEALRTAIRGRGWSCDVPLARLLVELGDIDAEILGAAARVESEGGTEHLPRLVLGFAGAHGADLQKIARDIAPPLAKKVARDPELLGKILAALGIPRARPARPYQTLEDPLVLGGNLAGVDDTPPVSVGKGSLRRRMQGATRELLEGKPATMPGAMIAALVDHDGVDAGTLLAAATWLACAPATDAVTSVLDHGGGERPQILTAAAADPTLIDLPTLSLSLSVAWHADPPCAALAARMLARGKAPVVADALPGRAATAFDEPRMQAAFAIALGRDSGPLLPWFDEPRLLSLALFHARHAPHEEVLQCLLDLPTPEAPAQRLLLARALACQGDRAAVTALDRLAAGDEALAPETERGHAILGAR